MQESVLKTINLTKRYGNRIGINNVSMNIKKGDIYGFIGRNGAGKTTFMKTCLGITIKDSGECEFFGKKDCDSVRRKVGALIENPAIYKNATALENMKYYATLFGGKEQIEDILEYVELSEVKNRVVGKYSLGMKQRLGIAIAMLGNPEMLVLDEPINGLDPAGIKKIRDLILRLNRDKKITFLISSHLLDELAKIATRYGIIENGVLIEESSAEELNEKFRKKIVIEVDNAEKAVKIIKDFVPVEKIYKSEKRIIIDENLELAGDINKRLVENDITVSMLYKKSQDLEQYFMEKVGGRYD